MGGRNLMSESFLSQFSKYEDYAPCGVLLPNIDIDKKFYSKLDLKEGSSNLDFLRKLCFNGVKEKGIDKLKNKQEYYDRVKMELNILNELGFVDYVLLHHTGG